MTLQGAMLWIVGLAVVYGPMIAWIAFEMSRAPLVDEVGNVIGQADTTDPVPTKRELNS